MSTNSHDKLMSNGLDFVSSQNDTYPFIDPGQHDMIDRHVLITGASKGVGRATAISFARAGASGIAVASRSDVSSLMKEIE